MATTRAGVYDWQEIGAELATNEQTRELAGQKLGLERPIYRQQFLAWRRRESDPFPGPVLLVPAAGRPIELWARAEILFWLARELERRGATDHV